MANHAEPYAACMLCPRFCGVNRLAAADGPGYRAAGGALGRCGESAALRLASASIHRGEEPPIGGGGGSGTIFVTGCGLGCGFCQNYQISRQGMGRPVDRGEFAAIALALQDAGAENINIVTGSHAAPAIAAALDQARAMGLNIPVLWNSSAYESETTLDLLQDRIDVYLPDLKTLDSRMGERFFQAPDYPEYARAAILRMLKCRGELRWKAAPQPGAAPPPGVPQPAAPVSAAAPAILVQGVIIRHLIIPGCLESTRDVIEWFSRHARGRALLSLMTQYTPCPSDRPGPQRRLIREEYEQVMDWLAEYGIEDGYYQEPSARRDWLPDFNQVNPFASRLSRPLWHWTIFRNRLY
ncbi:MAG: radical SAM protein [Treponema sp.]|jgi:putative pyruvate formate lyase activating enzyme|nr:radical SAM protein [Treponema sp.]